MISNTYTLKEAAKLLGCNKEVLRRRLKAGKIDSFKDGNRIKFTDLQIQEYVDRNSNRG